MMPSSKPTRERWSKRSENCPVCGRLMNIERLRDRRRLLRCKGEKEPRPHTTLVWVR